MMVYAILMAIMNSEECNSENLLNLMVLSLLLKFQSFIFFGLSYSFRCKNCGSSEHRHWECPQAQNFTNLVVCEKCGGGGHIASDCIYDGYVSFDWDSLNVTLLLDLTNLYHSIFFRNLNS